VEALGSRPARPRVCSNGEPRESGRSRPPAASPPRLAGGLLTTSTRPTLNLLLLLRASVSAFNLKVNLHVMLRSWSEYLFFMTLPIGAIKKRSASSGSKLGDVEHLELETVSVVPPVFRIRGFLSAAERASIIAAARPDMQEGPRG
jgi:hypothetical protein